jgi:BirA family biotin operon repressor/biotin-[acetyl-CoA-carboxylase] ligase
MAPSPAEHLVVPALLVRLADGRLRSGEELATELGVSRTAIWKAVLRLRAQGIAIEAEPRRGYRLARPVELLDAAAMRTELCAASRPALRRLESLFAVDSTNTRLVEAAPPPHGQADACLSELQHAGRGRRGRPWVAPFGSGLALSLAWSFRDAARDLPSLSLAVGVAVARALVRLGARDIRLKWPNDLWLRERKIGGVLIELRAEAGGPAHVVIGIGLNVALAPEARAAIEAGNPQGVSLASVAEACDRPPSRNRIAGATLDELLLMLAAFEQEGFTPFREAWSALDALHGRVVRVLLGERTVIGRAQGIDVDGALCVEVDRGLQRFMSGEVSLRLEEGAT